MGPEKLWYQFQRLQGIEAKLSFLSEAMAGNGSLIPLDVVVQDLEWLKHISLIHLLIFNIKSV